MLTLVLGKDWKANRDRILSMVAKDVTCEKQNIILLVPELISHDMERRLCQSAGDTVSRFAEVLSFPRLARRVADATNQSLPQCMDEGGRLVAMSAVTHHLHSRLKAYASVETRPEFLSGLVEAVDEFKRCCIRPVDLTEASRLASGSIAQKLEELGLIFEAYESVCARGKKDPRDQMSWLLEQLEDCNFAENHILYVDCFPDFTRQHMEILSHFIRFCPNVVVSLNCDKPHSKHAAFEKAGQTAAELIRAAKESGVSYRIEQMPEPEDVLITASESMFHGQLPTIDVKHKIKLVTTDSVAEECDYVAMQILELVQTGNRFRDIGIVCCNMNGYKHQIERIFSRYNIPVYISGTEDILEKSVVHTVIAALEAALSNLRQSDVLAYLKSAISPISMHECDLIENYAVIWNINANAWTQPWTKHPRGLVDHWSEGDYAQLRALEELRCTAIGPIEQLRKALQSADRLSQQIQALVQFLKDTALAQRLDSLAKEFDSQGDNRSAQIMQQLWEILLTAIDQMQDLLADTVWDNDAFLRLFKLLLGSYNVGTIPSMLDAVTAGSVSAMRCQRVKHLFVLGALEGSMPSYASVSGVLSEQERNTLRSLGVPLTGGALDGLNVEFSEIFGVFCGASESICVSHPAGQSCFAFQRLAQMGGKTEHAPKGADVMLLDPVVAATKLAACQMEEVAQELGLSKQYEAAVSVSAHALGDINAEVAHELYGNSVRFSATKTDTFGKCRLSYFLKYGVKATTRKVAEVDPAEFGTFVHAVLEKLGLRILEMGGFKSVSLEQSLELAQEIAQAYIADHFGEIESQRTSYLLRRNEKQLNFIVTDWWEEMQTSDFQPIGFEVSFGEGKIFDAIQICGKRLHAELEGFVDRVDIWEQEDKVYFRVVDYKTGKKAFDYCDVFNGIGLQMLLYLFALEQKGQSLLGPNPVPAGVLYFPARADYISAQGHLDGNQIDIERLKKQKRSGLLLDNDGVLDAMEPENSPGKLPVAKDKDGNRKGDIASQAQLIMLKRYITFILEQMADEIASGSACANPYTRGSNFDACAYCDYKNVCTGKILDRRRDYRTITKDEFWYYVEKELSDHGR